MNLMQIKDKTLNVIANNKKKAITISIVILLVGFGVISPETAQLILTFLP